MRNQALAGTTVATGVHQIGPKFFRIDARRKDKRIKGAGRYRERLFRGSLNEAKRARAELVLELEVPIKEVKEVPFFEDFVERWLVTKEGEVSITTGERYADTMALHITPTLGKMRMDAITRDDIKMLMASLQKKEAIRSVRRLVKNEDGMKKVVIEKRKLGRLLGRNSVHSVLRVLRNAWHEAQLQHPQLTDITTKIKLGTPSLPDPDECNSLTPAELARFLLAWVGSPHEAFVWTLAFTGLRFCHVSGLKWTDLDVDNMRIKVIRSHVLGRVSAPNTIKRVPGWTPLPALVVQKLLEHKATLQRQDHPGREWCFPSEAGKPQTPGCMHGRWKAAVKRASIPRRFSIHGARRTFIDLGRRAGATSIMMRAMVGHSTEGMHQHYSTIGADEKAAVADRALALVPITLAQ